MRVSDRQGTNRCVVTALAAGLLAGCGLTDMFDPEEIEAVRDYVYASDLEEVDEVRFFQQLSYTYVNDRFVTVPTSGGDYLVEFARDCPQLRSVRFTDDMVDYRDNNRTLKAGYDTIRGCRIGKIYEITDAQRREISELGDAPGDDVYLPGNEDS